MQLKLFAVYDKLNERINFPITAASVEQAIRENTPMLYQLNRDFEKEYVLLEYGFFDTRKFDSGFPDFVLTPIIRHAWTEYEHYHEIVERLTALEKKQLEAMSASPVPSSVAPVVEVK